MRCLIVAWVAFLMLGPGTFAAGASEEAFDWAGWRDLPVLAEGRLKPLDTVARENLLMLRYRESFQDPDTDRKLNATAFYLGTLFDWRGWDSLSSGASNATLPRHYDDRHEPDKWDRAPLFRVDGIQLRKALGIKGMFVSPSVLSHARIKLPAAGEGAFFVNWVGTVSRKDRKERSQLEEKGMDLGNKLGAYRAHRMGQMLNLIPVQGSKDQQWISVYDLFGRRFLQGSDSTTKINQARDLLLKLREAYRSDDAKAFNETSAEFIGLVRELGPQMGKYPDQATIDLEVLYNRVKPFRLAWVFSLAAFVCAVASMIWQRQAVYNVAIAAAGASLLIMLLGFCGRAGITGWVPVTNMYESVLFMAFGTIIFGLIYELRVKNRYVLGATAVVTAVALIIADFTPSVIDPSLRPLPPVLRSNIWLAVHVMSIMLSYSAFALALGIGNITLTHYLLGAKKKELIRTLSKLTLKLLQAGVLLLVIGTILGALWADDSWGRFWGWDPKEVWALITLMFYLAVVHSRYVGWISNLALAFWSVICFSFVVVMAWYGVNFVLATGMHTYGGGGGGKYYVFGTVGIQFLYALAAALRHTAFPPRKVA